MYIKKELFTGGFSSKHIEENCCRTGDSVLYARMGNEYIAILIDSSCIGNCLPAPFVTMDTVEKTPLWKQSMNMQMGRIPQATRSSRTTKQVRWMTEKEIHGNMKFEVYRCVYL